MQPRRPIALAAAALLLCVPVLSSCGFNKALDKQYTPGQGTNYRKGDVFVLSAVIAAKQPDSGTLIASFTNQTTSTTETLESVAGASGNSVQAADFDPIAIKPMGFVNLEDAGPVTLTGSFAAGDMIPLSLNFENGATIEMDVPVVYACQEYTGLDVSQASASASTSASVSASASASEPGVDGSATPLAGDSSAAPPTAATGSATPSGEATPSPSDTSEPSATGSPTSYTCGTSGGTGGRN